ncbi:cytidyltransferase-like domain-containing protein [Butyrivibrio sp. INlla18]|nr:cytidyltransferase-like domain-containing protein [Butyrivibrio sp. INlla18]
MKTVAVIAEFNPFHNGHNYILEKAKEITNAENVIVIMSGDFVQRGAPAFMDKFSRTICALNSGADLVLELPIYYSLGSAEYFAQGAVSILDRLGIVTDLVFGSECDDLALLSDIADILVKEPEEFKEKLQEQLKNGDSFALAREKAVLQALHTDDSKVKDILSSPNSILSLEYLKALKRLNSTIEPHTIKRVGSDYNSKELSNIPSATAIRSFIAKNGTKLQDELKEMVSKSSFDQIINYQGSFGNTDNFTKYLYYKIMQAGEKGLTEYLDINEELSNKILDAAQTFKTFDELCAKCKSKNMTYSRISRSLMHIVLDMKASNMEEYKADGYTGYARILGMKKDISPSIKTVKNIGNIKIFNQLKEAKENLSELEMRLLNETLFANKLYSLEFKGENVNEYRLQPIIL